MDHDTRLAELSRIVWRWRSGDLSRRRALRLLTSLGLSLGGGLGAIGAARGMNHQPGHIDEEAADPDAVDAEAKLVTTDVDTSYDPDLDPDLMNPERGMYFGVYPGEATIPDPDNPNGPEIPDPRRQSHTLVHGWLYLAEWCNKDLIWDPDNPALTSEVLRTYAGELEDARTKGVKVLFRPRYDRRVGNCDVPSTCTVNGTPVFHADTIERQKQHIDAVAAMLADYKDVIAFIQAGYLGNWGEWNTASSGGCPAYSPANAPLLYCCTDRNAIIDHMLSAYAAAGIAQDVEIRTPVFAKEVVERYSKDDKPAPNIGLHNDCFMSSEDSDDVPVDGSDSGTYSDFFGCCPPPCDCCCPQQPCDSTETCDCPQTCCSPPNCGSLENFESEIAARAWAAGWTADSSFGGETCRRNPTGSERWRYCRNMIGANSEPASLRMNYLNGDHAEGAVDAWELGDNDGDTCYADIRRELGYRFEVTSVEYTQTVAIDQMFLVRVAIKNTGWAKLHKPRQARFVLRDSGVLHDVPDQYVSSGEVASWAPGETTTVSAYAPAPTSAGKYSVRLWIPDPDAESRIAYAVKLATLRNGANVFDPTNRGENDLGVWITVEELIDRDPPVISQVMAEATSGNRAIVRWRTNEPADSQVAYGPGGSRGFQTPLDETPKILHAVVLTGLIPRTQYGFETKSRDQAGNLATATGGFANPASPN